MVDIVTATGLAFSMSLIIVGTVLVRRGRKLKTHPLPPPPPAMQLSFTLPFTPEHVEGQEEEKSPSILGFGKKAEQWFDKKD